MSDTNKTDSLIPDFGDYSLDSILSEYGTAKHSDIPTIPIDPADDAAADDVAERARQMVMQAWNDASLINSGRPIASEPAPRRERPAAPVSIPAAEVTADYNKVRRDKHNFIEISTPPIDFLKDTPEDSLPEFDPMDSLNRSFNANRRGPQHQKRSARPSFDNMMPSPIDSDEFEDIRREASLFRPSPAPAAAAPAKPDKKARKKQKKRPRLPDEDRAPVSAPVRDIPAAPLSPAAPKAPAAPVSPAAPKVPAAPVSPAAPKAQNVQRSRNAPRSRSRSIPGPAPTGDVVPFPKKAPAAKAPVKDARSLLLEELQKSTLAAPHADVTSGSKNPPQTPAAENEAQAAPKQETAVPPQSAAPAKHAAPEPPVRPADPQSAAAQAPAAKQKQALPKAPHKNSAGRTPSAPDRSAPVRRNKTGGQSTAAKKPANSRERSSAPKVTPIRQPKPAVSADTQQSGGELSGSVLRPLIGSVISLFRHVKDRASDRAERSTQTADRTAQPETIPEPSAERAARYYASYIKPLQLRTRIAIPLCLILIWIALRLPMAGMLGASVHLQAGASLVLTLAVAMTALDIVTAGIRQIASLNPGPEAMAVLAVGTSCLDAVLALFSVTDVLPYCTIGAIALTAGLWGERLRCTALYRTMRTAAGVKTPSIITVESDEPLGINILLHTERDTAGLVRQCESRDYARNTYSAIAPFILGLSVLLSIVSALHSGGIYFLHSLSALLSVTLSFSAFFAFTLPYARTAKKLQPSGSAIAGYAGCRHIGKIRRVVVKDEDLFPPGTMRFAEINIQSGAFVSKVISCTSCMIEQAGCGVAQLFGELMTRRGYEPVEIRDLQCHQGGGLSAICGDDPVLVGSVGFMNLNSIRLPQGIDPKYSICTAISGELVAVFTIDYIPVTSVQDALATQLRSKIQAVFAIRDFNISPLMIRQLFKFDSSNFNFPSFLDRDRLAGKTASKDAPVCAVLVRSGLMPVMDVAEYGRRLYITTRINTIIGLIGSIIGMLVMFLLCQAGAFETASAGNVTVFMLLWTLPVLVLS